MVTVVAVIVAYRPGSVLIEELRALSPQVSAIVLVDNGSEGKLRELAASFGSPIYLLDPGRNLGVGAAHNLGIQKARQLRATHVLLMDQDSIPQPDMVDHLLAAEKRLADSGERIGAVGPVYHDPRLAKSWPFYRMSRFGVRAHDCENAFHVACDFLISSGTLIRLPVLDAVGAMKDVYFLEHIDTEWSLRARSAGYALYGVCDARMEHYLGDETVAVPFTSRRVQLYRPYRHYYLFRNALLLWRERHASLPWKVNELRRLLYRLVFFSLFVPPRRERLRFMLLGLWHGLLGRTGPLSA